MTWQTIRTLTTQAAEAGVPSASVFVVHPDSGQFSTWQSRIPYAEIGFDSLVLAGGPTAVTLAVWRLSGGKVERLLTTTIQATDLAAPIPLDVEVDAEGLWVTVDSFIGGAGQTLSGVIRFRPSRSGAPRQIPGGGVATAGNQSIEIASLASIDSKVKAGQTGAQAVTGITNVLPVVRYTATRPTLADGQAVEVQGNTRGDVSFAEAFAPQYEDNTYQVAATSRRFIAAGPYSPTLLVKDFGATITKNAKIGAGIVTAIIGDNGNAAVRYLQLHDTATTPSGGAVPALCFRVPATSAILIGEDILSENGWRFTNGCAYAWSTTAGTYTAATVTDHNTQVYGV